MMRFIRCAVLAISYTCISFGSSQAQQYWNTNGTNANLTAINWGTSASGPFTNAFTPGGEINFTASSAITNVTNTVVGNFVVADGVTVNWTAAATMTTGGNVRTLTVGTGSVLDFAAQGVSTATGTGFIKNGSGILYSGNGNAYGGGFTLNQGTVIVGGVNALGGNTGNTLTINGGTVTANNTRNLSGKYTGGIVIGGNFTLGGVTTGVTTANGSATANLTFDDLLNLGSAIRSINLGGSGVYTLAGVTSGTGGINVTNSSSGTGRLVLSNANTYTGGTTISAGTLVVTNTTGSGTGTGAITIGSTGVLSGGTGTGTTIGVVTGATTVQSGGTIRGDSGTGTNTLTTGNVTIQSGGILGVQLGTGTTASKLNTSAGVLDLNSGAVIDPNGTLGSGSRVIANLRTTGTGELVVNGTAIETDTEIGAYTFATGNTGLQDLGTSGLKIDINGLTLAAGDKFTLNRTGNDLVLTFTPVPEPAFVLSAVGVLAGAVVGVRRLRRKGTPEVTPAA